MKVNFEKLKEGRNSLTFDIPSKDVAFDYKGYKLNGNWHINADFFKNSRGEISLIGDLEGKITLICDRCLKEFERKVFLKFEYFFVPFEEVEVKEEGDLNDGVVETFYRDNFVEMEDILSEQVILSLPDKVLCDESCRGILKEDGSPYIEEEGEEKPLDSRLLPLLEIKKRLKK